MKKSNAIGHRVGTEGMTYNKSSTTFVCEMSELEHRGIDPFGQLYPDSAARGFVMVSSKTGNELAFVLSHTEREADGDLRYWLFEAAVYKAFDPELAGLKVMIVNT